MTVLASLLRRLLPAALRATVVGQRLRAVVDWAPRLRERLIIGWGHWRWRWHPALRWLEVAAPPGHGGPLLLRAGLDPRDMLAPARVRTCLLANWPADPNCLVLLVRYRRPPRLACRVDAEVRSWAAAPELLAQLPPFGTCLLTILDLALRLPHVTVRVVQVGGRPGAGVAADLLAPTPTPLPVAEPVTWLVPHRGSLPWLAACLHRLTPQLGPADQACVCFDEALTAAHQRLPPAFPQVTFSTLAQPGVGPFVARQRLLEQTTDPLVLFQDSDDLPTADRCAVLRAALRAGHLDAVGSHELRLDYLTRRVVAVRFPLDASAALRVAMGHPVLFPTLLIRRASLLAVGGFSTYLRFALDTQLLLRASLSWRIGNTDAFLYLRRRRPDSLTTAPATALGSPARERHRAQWKADFAAVKAGDLALAASSLAVRRGAEYAGNALCPLAGRAAPMATPGAGPDVAATLNTAPGAVGR